MCITVPPVLAPLRKCPEASSSLASVLRTTGSGAKQTGSTFITVRVTRLPKELQVLGGSWLVINGGISPLIWVIKHSYPTSNPT